MLVALEPTICFVQLCTGCYIMESVWFHIDAFQYSYFYNFLFISVDNVDPTIILCLYGSIEHNFPTLSLH
jgi:hypothetical protein